MASISTMMKRGTVIDEKTAYLAILEGFMTTDAVARVPVIQYDETAESVVV